MLSELSRLLFYSSRYLPSLNYAQGKNVAIALAITLARTSLRASPVTICDVICRCLLYDCKMRCSRELYVSLRFATGVSVCIVIWEVAMNCMFLMSSLQVQD